MIVLDPDGRVKYYTVPAVSAESVSETVYHNQLSPGTETGIMTVSIEALTPLFVGTGDYEIDPRRYQPFFRRGGGCVIPGTSVKGVVRSYAEALSPSCMAGNCSVDHLCICCAVFGMLGIQGRLTFLDAVPQSPNSIVPAILCLEVRWGPRLDYPGQRKLYIHDDYRQWIARPQDGERFETVNKGAKFTCSIHFNNIAKREMGLLLLAMGLSPGHRFDLKMGGGKNRGLGSVRLSVLGNIELMNKADSYTSFAETVLEKTLDEWGCECVAEYLDNLSKRPLDKILNEILPLIQNNGSLPKKEGSDTNA